MKWSGAVVGLCFALSVFGNLAPNSNSTIARHLLVAENRKGRSDLLETKQGYWIPAPLTFRWQPEGLLSWSTGEPVNWHDIRDYRKKSFPAVGTTEFVEIFVVFEDDETFDQFMKFWGSMLETKSWVSVYPLFVDEGPNQPPQPTATSGRG